MENVKKDKSIFEETLLEYDTIDKMVSNTTSETIKAIVSEKIKDTLKNMITEDNDFDEEEVEVGESDNEDGMDDTNPETGNELESENEPESVEDGVEPDGDTEEGDGMEPEIGDDEDDFNFDDFKTGDDEYDLTNNSIEDVVKVFKKIDDNDSIIVKKLENGKVELIDNEAGTDYLIDLGNDDSEIEIELDDEIGDGDDDVVDNELPESTEADLTEETDIEVELDGAESAVDEKNITSSIGTNRRAGRMTQTRQEYAPGANNRDGAKLIANESKKLAEAYALKVKQIEAVYADKFKSLNEEVSQYKQALSMFRDKLKENAVLNNNLAKYVKLVTENATTKDEKIQILERFSREANTIEAGNKLFESINNSLNKKGTPEINVEKQFIAAAPAQRLDEQVIYQSKDLQETIGLINRMNGLNRK